MKIYGTIVLVVAVLLGVYFYQQHKATLAANNGDTISPDSSVTTSLAPPDPAPVSTPAPAKRTAMPGSTSVSTPVTTSTQTSLSSDTSAVPASDTIERTPPNGMVFAGTGHMQVYRQGNITWRINTDTGDACVLFATDREWRKPRVYNAGCRKS